MNRATTEPAAPAGHLPIIDVGHENLLNNLFEGLYIVDQRRRIIFWNRAAEQITGFARDEVMGNNCADGLLRHISEEGEIRCFSGCPLRKALEGKAESEQLLYFHHKEGHRVPVIVRIAPLIDGHGNVVGAAEMFRDAHKEVAQKERINQLEEMAFVDSLTGLANRRFLLSRVENQLDELRRYDWPFGVLFIDIDHFKNINDTHGHDMGDRVLQMVSATLKSIVRGHDFVARYGGEEFVVILTNVNQQQLVEIGERFRVLVSMSSIREPAPISVTVSIGATLAGPDDTPETLFKRADLKLYEAKNAGRNSIFT